MGLVGALSLRILGTSTLIAPETTKVPHNNTIVQLEVNA